MQGSYIKESNIIPVRHLCGICQKDVLTEHFFTKAKANIECHHDVCKQSIYKNSKKHLKPTGAAVCNSMIEIL